MDFRGQELAERLYQSIILFFTVISFVMGYATQDFSLMIKLFGGGTGIAALVTLFDWPMFNKDPVKWRKPTRHGDGASSRNSGSKSPGAMEILWNLFN
jgi:signal peptidase complex subunit 1